MKKITFLIFCISFFNLIAQEESAEDFFDYGVVAGFNYGSNGVLKDDFNTNNLKSNNKYGYHAGLYVNLNFKKWYLRPEFLYTKTKSEYSISNQTNDFNISKLDFPLIYGYKIFKPLSVFVGPSLQYIINTDFEDIDTEEIDVKNDFSVNMQFGVALKLGSQIRIDARYETGISENIATLEDQNTNSTSNIDTKPNQLIISLSLQL